MKNTNLRTFSGHLICLEDPQPEHVVIVDIAHSLAKTPRYNAHNIAIQGLSVAQHSVLVSEIIWAEGGDQRDMFAGLMHDAHEAYVGDVISPLKRLPELKEGFKIIDERFMRLIDNVFNMPWTDERRALVARADEIALATEMSLFTSENDYSGSLGIFSGYPRELWSASHARDKFLNCYRNLISELR